MAVVVVDECVSEAGEEVYDQKDCADWDINFGFRYASQRCPSWKEWRTMLWLLLHVGLLCVRNLRETVGVEVNSY